MSRPRARSYKRTWKNLLINKRYQLRFTLFMVVLSGLLISLLGWWVMAVAARATTVAVNNVLTACQDLPGARPAEPTPEPADKGDRPRPVVTIDDSGMAPAGEPPSAAPGAGPTREQVSGYERCQSDVPVRVKELEGRQRLIFWMLIATGVLVEVALMLYGIKMTHKVAGPLHKVTLYMAKLRSGLYDVVYSLRKGDHLVEFYEHFKRAHSGLRAVQEEDVARLRSVLTAAEKAGLAGRSPELAAAVEELRDLADRKEKSLA